DDRWSVLGATNASARESGGRQDPLRPVSLGQRTADASAPSELFDEQHSYLIVELSRSRDGQLDTHGESRPREGLHVQAGDEGDLAPEVLGDGGRGRAELDERGEPSGHRPGGGKPAVELLGVLGLECPFVGHLADEIEGADGDGGGGERFQRELAAETLLLGTAREGGGDA